MNKTFVAAALFGLLTANQAMAHAVPKDKEKCYGIAEKGKNDCGSKKHKHGCAGQAKADHDPYEWKFVKKGECVGLKGSLTPPADETK